MILNCQLGYRAFGTSWRDFSRKKESKLEFGPVSIYEITQGLLYNLFCIHFFIHDS